MHHASAARHVGSPPKRGRQTSPFGPRGVVKAQRRRGPCDVAAVDRSTKRAQRAVGARRRRRAVGRMAATAGSPRWTGWRPRASAAGRQRETSRTSGQECSALRPEATCWRRSPCPRRIHTTGLGDEHVANGDGARLVRSRAIGKVQPHRRGGLDLARDTRRVSSCVRTEKLRSSAATAKLASRGTLSGSAPAAHLRGSLRNKGEGCQPVGSPWSASNAPRGRGNVSDCKVQPTAKQPCLNRLVLSRACRKRAILSLSFSSSAPPRPLS